MSFIGLLRTLEAMTRPLSHDVDLPVVEHCHVWETPCNVPTCPCRDSAEQLAEREAEEEVSEPEDDSLACPYPDCVRYVDHRGPHEFPWGDSIPWPPEADLNDDVTPNPSEPGLTSDELVGVRGLLQERYEPQLLMPCPVDDCEFGGSSYDEVNKHSYWDHLQPNPFEISDDPLVEHKRYPGVTEAGDFRWFNVKVTKSSASNHAGTGADPAPSPTIVQSAPPPTVDGEGPSEDCGIPPSHSEGRPTSELLIAAAQRLTDYFGGAQRPYEALVPPLIADLRARAATFKNIEQDK